MSPNVCFRGAHKADGQISTRVFAPQLPTFTEPVQARSQTKRHGRIRTAVRFAFWGNCMKANWIAAITALLIGAGCSFAAASPHQWKSGTLLESEKQQVLEGSTETSNTDGTI